MKDIRLLTQQKLSILLAIYIGFFLNASVFFRRFSTTFTFPTLTNTMSALAEVVACVLVTFLLMRILSLSGKRIFRIVVTLVILTSVAASYYMTFFNVVIGYGIVASVLTNDIDLSREVVGINFLVWMISVSALPLLLLWRSQLNLTLLEQCRTPAKRTRQMVILIVSILLVWLPLRYLGEQQSTRGKISDVDLPSYGGVVAHSYIPSNWISALGLFTFTQVSERLNNRSLFDPSAHFDYIAPAGIDDTYIVFVIGETTRWDHMGILGYARNTTPELAKEKNLVAFRGQSCDTSTRLSLRCMFVREGGTLDNPDRTLKEQNIFAVLKSLGFSSELFAMQSEVWFYTNADTDNYSFREQIAAEERNQGKSVDDMLLIPELQESLARHPGGKHLVILHTKGSHYLYSQRYPRDFARYQPECKGVDDVCSKARLINAYDNSVLYTDSVLKNVFDQLRDKKAIVFYASDHGESIDENQQLHGTPRDMAPAEQFRVPLIVWASDKYLSDDNNRSAFDRLKAQQRAGTVHRHVELFDSILGCLGYHSPDGGINPANNWCQAPVMDE